MLQPITDQRAPADCNLCRCSCCAARESFHCIDRRAKFRTPGASFMFNDLWPRSTIFVRRMNAAVDYNVDMLTSYGWYVACSRI